MVRTVSLSAVALVAWLACTAASAGMTIEVPSGSAVLPDGQCEASEWAGAREVPLPDGVTLRLQQSPDFLYLCIQPRQPAWFGVDLYIARRGEAPFNLHASAKLGERVWKADRWSDFVWWDQSGWVANTSRGVVFERREFLPDRAKEIQVSRARLGAQPFQLMVEIHGERSVVAPEQSRSDQPGGWFTVSFGQQLSAPPAQAAR